MRETEDKRPCFLRPMRFSALLLVLFVGCGSPVLSEGDAGGGVGDSGSVADAGLRGTRDGGPGTLSCDVETVARARCWSCHGPVPSGGAPSSLVTAADFMAPSAREPSKTMLERSLVRMTDSVAPMPTTGLLPAAEVAVFQAWLDADFEGAPCRPDAGSTIDAGPPPQTCQSNRFQPKPVVGNDHGSRTMAPGYACIACHSGQNFANQNPGGLRASREIFQFMGTVFSERHAKDLCVPTLTTAAQVEIYDQSGTKRGTFTVNSGGNFYGNVSGGMPSPYTAKVVTSSGSRSMVGAQTSGDCNTCHTADGREGAPGRLTLP